MPLVAPWNRKKKRRTRERLGHEQPGAVFGGPPITVTCKCGEKRELKYGEEWTCESCGRRWDTNQIPAEQYRAIRNTQLRFRVLPVAYGLAVLALAMFFTLTGNIFSVFILLPLEVSDEIRPGVVSVPHGFGHVRQGVGWRLAAEKAGASVNDVTDSSVVDAITGNAAFNAVPVRVEAA